MMITFDFPGAAEGDLRTDAIGIVNLYGSIGLHRINARTGMRVAVPDPPDVIRWPRITPAGALKISGQGQTLNSFEWDGGTWTDTGPAHGASPTIYDGGNVLHIIRPAADQTVNGYRCLDRLGRPVLGEATLAIATVPKGRLLHKYTPIETPAGVILIGQDHESGVHVIFEEVRHVLDRGSVEFIRAAWTAADGLAVLVSHYDERLVRTFLLTLEALRTLPVFEDPAGPPIDPPIDPPPALRPPVFTIASPQFPQAGAVPFTVRCVYLDEVDEHGRPLGGPLDWIDWLIGGSPSGPWAVNAHNPGDDADHTYRFWEPGLYYIKARGGNAAGTHETGAVRAVEATGPPDPPDPPDPPAGARYRLQTAHGGYLTVRPDRFLEEGPHGSAFEIVSTARPDVIGLKVDGGIVAAEPDGRLKADRGSVSDWEYFEQTILEGPIWQFRSEWLDRYISAHNDGTVLADQGVADALESFRPSEAPSGGGGTVSRWHVDGWLFRDAKNAAVRLMGYSGFQVLRRLADGAALDPLFEYFRIRSANCLRAWDYLPAGHPIAGGWASPTIDQTIRGIEVLRSWGLTTYLTLLTDDDPARIPWAQTLVRELGAARLEAPPLIEIGNEPRINKLIDTRALEEACRQSGLLFTSGEYADSALWFGTNGDAHTPRDLEWPRKAHDLHEYQVGGGPSYPAEPACKVPWFGGEPIKPTEAPNAPQTDPTTGGTIYRAEDFLAYAAACGLMGAGAVFHYEGGKTGQLPSGDEIACCDDFFDGLRAFPAEMLGPGSYQRIDEHGATLRTYRKGPYTVRIRPTSGPIILTDATARIAEYTIHVSAPISDAAESALIAAARARGVAGPITLTLDAKGSNV